MSYSEFLSKGGAGTEHSAEHGTYTVDFDKSNYDLMVSFLKGEKTIELMVEVEKTTILFDDVGLKRKYETTIEIVIDAFINGFVWSYLESINAFAPESNSRTNMEKHYKLSRKLTFLQGLELPIPDEMFDKNILQLASRTDRTIHRMVLEGIGQPDMDFRKKLVAATRPKIIKNLTTENFNFLIKEFIEKSTKNNNNMFFNFKGSFSDPRASINKDEILLQASTMLEEFHRQSIEELSEEMTKIESDLKELREKNILLLRDNKASSNNRWTNVFKRKKK